MDHTGWAARRGRYLAPPHIGLPIFWDPIFIGDIESRNFRPSRSPASPVGSRLANGKNGRSASNGPCLSAGLRPLRGAGRDAFDRVGLLLSIWAKTKLN